MRPTSVIAHAALFAALVAASPIFAQHPGSVDTSFGWQGGGWATEAASDGGLFRDSQVDLEVIPDNGRILMVGAAERSGHFAPILWQVRSDGMPHNVDGVLDLGNGQGFCQTDTSGFRGAATDLALWPEGFPGPDFVIVAGATATTAPGDYFWAVSRVVTDWLSIYPLCAPDTEFGTGGYVTYNPNHVSNGDDRATAVAVLTYGTYVAGFAQINDTGDFDVRVLRYKANGTLDDTFGVGGVASIWWDVPGGLLDDRAVAIAVRPNGYVVVGARVHAGYGDNDFGVAQLTPGGSLDTSFGSGGKVRLDFGTGGGRNDDEMVDLALERDGRIVVFGSTTGASTSGRDFAAARLSPSGALDPTFSGDGKLVFGINLGEPNHDTARDLLVETSGAILLAGDSDRDTNDSDLTLLRLRHDGTIDTGFGFFGVAVLPYNHDFTNTYLFDRLGGVAVTEGGRKIVVGGYVNVNPTLRTDSFVTQVFNGPDLFHDDFEGENLKRWSVQATP